LSWGPDSRVRIGSYCALYSRRGQGLSGETCPLLHDISFPSGFFLKLPAPPCPRSPPPPPRWHHARAIPRDPSRLVVPLAEWGPPKCHARPLRQCTHAMASADAHGMEWASKFKFQSFGEDGKRSFATSLWFPPCLVVSPLPRRFPLFGCRAWMRSCGMSVRGPDCAPNTNAEEAGVARLRVPMSRDRTTPTTGIEGRNTHRCGEHGGTTCEKVSATDRDSEDASSEENPCPGQETSWMGAYEQSYLERK
jgi:hypothetical protein